MHQSDRSIQDWRTQWIGEDDHGPHAVGTVSIRPEPNRLIALASDGEIVVEVGIQEVAIAQRKGR
jgi:hypothetical protein